MTNTPAPVDDASDSRHRSGFEVQRGVVVPGYVAGILGVVLASGITAGVAVIVDTRTSVAVLAARVDQNTKDIARASADGAGVPAQLAVLTQQVKSLSDQMTAMSAKLDERGRR